MHKGEALKMLNHWTWRTQSIDILKFFFWVQQSVDINGQIEKKRSPQKQKCVTGKEKIPIEVHLIYSTLEHEGLKAINSE
uniref:Uncharacterized protein n=2 Tax=Solanum tuberosum TaxID=4113 RepID=M1BXE3_SOLTU